MNIDLMQLEFIDKNLRLMAVEIEEHFGIVLTVTSLYRMKGNGVHTTLPLRGLDFRCRDKTFGDLIVSYINKHWRYDSKRPYINCCLCHDVGKGLHLHLQTSENTKRR